jgi:hypothetical protein
MCDDSSHICGTDIRCDVCVHRRIGKNWSKGLTAATDARVARAAAAHRGMNYERRTPPEDCKWPISGRTTLPLEWSDDMAYIVGLTATDGCLYTGFRKINFKSCDRELVDTYRGLLGRTNRIKEQTTRTGGTAYFVDFGDSALYRWFESIGLTPRKSLTLGPLDVPDRFLAPLLRGLLEGDGTLQNFTHRSTRSTYPEYRYERLWTYFSSASRPHLEWVQARVATKYGLKGRIEQMPRRDGRHDFFRLKYGNRESMRLLPTLYPVPDVPKLERKWRIWSDYARRHGLS